MNVKLCLTGMSEFKKKNYHKIGKGEIVKLVYLYFYGTFDKMQHKRIEDCVTDRKLRVGVNVAFCG